MYSYFCPILHAQGGKEEGQDFTLFHAVWYNGGFLQQLKIQLCLEILCYFRKLQASQASFAVLELYKDVQS